MKNRNLFPLALIAILGASPFVATPAQAQLPHERIQRLLFGKDHRDRDRDRDRDKDRDKDRKKRKDDDRDRDHRHRDYDDRRYDRGGYVHRDRPSVSTSLVIERAPVVVYPERRYSTYEEERHDFRPVEVDVQLALRRAGYYRGPIDGDVGPGTRGSIRAYQYDNDLPVTGRIDRYLLRSLGL